MGLEDLIRGLVGGGGPPGMTPGAGMAPGMPSPASPGMPPMPPPGPMGMPEIPAGDSASMGEQVKSIGTQVSHIGAQLMSRGMHDAAISCAKAVKELEKVPELIANQAQQANPPPMMGMAGMEGTPPGMPPMGPPPLPGY